MAGDADTMGTGNRTVTQASSLPDLSTRRLHILSAPRLATGQVASVGNDDAVLLAGSAVSISPHRLAALATADIFALEADASRIGVARHDAVVRISDEQWVTLVFQAGAVVQW